MTAPTVANSSPIPEGHHLGFELAGLTARFDWQSILFASEPERGALLRLKASWPLSVRRIGVHRNHAIENSLSVLRPFLEYTGIHAEFIVGDYDDSLSFSAPTDADVEVIWLDYTRLTHRLSEGEIATWLGDRVAALRALTDAPILVLDWDGPRPSAAQFSARVRNRVDAVGDVRLADRQELFDELGEDYFDLERVSLTGTRMSRRGAVLTARLLGTRWLPAIFQPRLKAVVVDLDNTLYDGVLAEDGSTAVVLTEGHAELHRQLLALRDSGLFLGLVSRNVLSDVRELFRERTDFPLRWEDFSAHSVSWQPKSEGLKAIARALRIDTSAIVFVDDNAGELLETTQHVSHLRSLHAGRDAHATVNCLRFFPGLWAFENTATDALRVADLRANKERDLALAVAADDASYYRELQVVLTFSHGREAHLGRVAELSGKTNQFNLALQRHNEVQLRAMITDSRFQISTASLLDRLTDSGVIAMAVSERKGDALLVHDLCISCRALGRRLEDLIVAQLLASGPAFAGALDVVFTFREGPRNQPARSWLEQFARIEIPSSRGSVQISTPAQQVASAGNNPAISIAIL